MTDGPDPLILTLELDAASFAHFDGLRRRHFPAARNFIPAHLTLFHHLPGERAPDIAARLGDIARGAPRMTLNVTGLRFLGRGVAYTLESEALQRLRGELARDWSGALTAQDRQPFRPHVTIQNKASPDDARSLHATLSSAFTPFAACGTGLRLWRYRGGPWERAGTFPFDGALRQQSLCAESARRESDC